MARLRPRKKEPGRPAQNTRPAEPAPVDYRPPDPLSWYAFKRKFPGGRVPRLPLMPPGVAEAQARAEHASRQAEEQAERARIKAELAAEKARREAYVEGLWEEFERGSRWIDNSPDNGHWDVRNIKF
jgi:hypothetical protein